MTEDRTAESATVDTEDKATRGTPAEKPAKSARPRGTWLAFFLAFIALITAGGAGFLAWQQQQTATALEARLAELDTTLSAQLAERASATSVQRLTSELQAQKQALDVALAQQTDTLRAELEALRNETRAQQQALDTLRTLTGRDERLWRLGEIERLLTAAQTRLRLLDDAATARLLLQEIDRTAAPLGGEALPLRETVQQAMTGLASGASLDREGIALRLTQLAEVLPDLPLAKAGSDEPQPTMEEGWWPQTKAWVGSWLHIANKNGAPTTARQDDTLKAATAQLLDARRALLARDTGKAHSMAKQVLDAASARLDGKDARTATMLDDLRGIVTRLAQPAPATVDLTPAFTALRALRAASSPTSSPTSTGGE